MTHWQHEVGYQAFDYVVNGATTMSARRDLDRWSPDDFDVVIAPKPGGGGSSD